MASPISSFIRGTTISVRMSRVVDGDTLRVYLPGNAKPESIRILCVDTEESYTFSHKPVTPLGKAAKKFASSFFNGAETVTLEFPDDSPLSVAMNRHRGAFNRLLVHVWRESDGADFCEALIHNGYSPYCFKYGHASFASHRARYTNAERHAQAHGLGVWDPSHTINGGVVYNEYPKLFTWWSLRASGVDEFRKVRGSAVSDTSVLHSIMDYDEIVARATPSEDGDAASNLEKSFATVFVDIRELRVISGANRFAVADVGAKGRPLSLYIPNVDSAGDDDEENNNEKKLGKGSQAVALIRNRYLDEGPEKPRRGYAFVSGRLQLWRGNPQLVVDDPILISDIAGPRAQSRPTTLSKQDTTVIDVENPDVQEDVEEGKENGENIDLGPIILYISAVMPDPAGFDSTSDEIITVKAVAGQEGTENEVSLDGWSIKDASGRKIDLDGSMTVNGDGKVFSGLRLNNTGDSLFLIDNKGRVIHQVSYSDADVKTGTPVEFPQP